MFTNIWVRNQSYERKTNSIPAAVTCSDGLKDYCNLQKTLPYPFTMQIDSKDDSITGFTSTDVEAGEEKKKPI